MSYIFIYIVKAVVGATGYQFNSAANSMYAPTVAAWPLSPLSVP